MWLIGWLPDWIFHLVVLAGLAGVFISQFIRFVPFLYPYKSPILWAALALLVSGIWFEGGLANEDKWAARVKELEIKIAISEEKMKAANAEIEQKAVEAVNQYKARNAVLNNYITLELTKHDATCTIPNEFIVVHNDAAEAIK